MLAGAQQTPCIRLHMMINNGHDVAYDLCRAMFSTKNIDAIALLVNTKITPKLDTHSGKRCYFYDKSRPKKGK